MLSTSTDSEATAETAWSNAIEALYTFSGLAPYLPSTTTMTETSTSTASATFKQTTKTLTTHDVAGTSSDPALPYRTCEIITFRTLYATRWGRGRWYFPGLAYNALAADGYSLLAAAQTALVDGMNAFFGALSGSLIPCIRHINAPKDGAIGAYSNTIITACDIPNTFATQRRRADKIVPTRVTVTV